MSTTRFSFIAAVGGVIAALAGCASPVTDTRGDTVDQTSAALAIPLDSGGAGCPNGSVEASLSDDKQVLTLALQDLSAEIGPDTSGSDSRKSCMQYAQVPVPPGSQYAVAGIDVHAFTYLDAALRLDFATSTRAGGASQVTRFRNTTTGPFADDYYFIAPTAEADLSWSACNTQNRLVISTSVTLSRVGAEEDAIGALHAHADGDVTQRLNLVWRACP